MDGEDTTTEGQAPAGTPSESPADTTKDTTPADKSQPNPQSNAKPDTVAFALFEKEKEEKNRLLKKLKDFEAKERAATEGEQKRKEAELPELDRLRKEAASLKQERDLLDKSLKERSLALEVSKLARGLKFRDPEDALAFISGRIEYDEDTGQPSNLDTLLRDLKKSKPYLAEPEQRQQPGQGAGQPQPSVGSANNAARVEQLTQGLTLDKLEKLSTADFNLLWDAKIAQRILREAGGTK